MKKYYIYTRDKIRSFLYSPFNFIGFKCGVLKNDLLQKDNNYFSPSINLQRIKLKNKSILIVVAHIDDESIFCSSVLSSDEAKNKHILVVHDGGEKRNQAIKKIGEITNSKITNLMIKESFGENNVKEISSKNKEIISKKVQQIIKEEKINILISHNEFGEYGHGHHREVYNVIAKINLNKGIEKYEFGYSYPSLFPNGHNPWKKSLKVFSNLSPWKRESNFEIKEFSGLFSFKKYKENFYFETNYYYPQKNKKLLQQIISIYDICKTESWMGWMKKSTHYYKYFSSNIQLFSKKEEYTNPIRYYKFPNIMIRKKEPIIFKNVSRKIDYIKKSLLFSDDIRSFNDLFLIDYIKLDGDCLWIGWNQLCAKKKYDEKVKKYASSLDILDYNKIRSDKSIYGNKIANLIGDITNVKNIISNEKYDSIHCLGVLEYINYDKVESAISELARILKPKGRILLGITGYDYEKSGHTRLHYDDVLKLLKKHKIQPIEVWRKYNEDFYYIHAYKNE